ncbi:homoserine dehydrogenase [Pedobacter sp. UYP30]|uniref:homoserine dehydrogenase n=1 Tax=Pedobacter sp. UYP30 TaxID=1756400 RepID=UPI0033970F0F
MSKKLKIGLFGFGVVGQGLLDIIQSQQLNLEIVKIAIKDPSKQRTLQKELFTTNHTEILENSEINTVIELINDADAAYTIVTTALKSGKNVVSANKKMIATHLKELVELQQKHGTSLLYEGAVCGSIPIIRNLEEYYDNELFSSISGIFNGSSNYILTKVFNENQSYEDALKKAQELGFAETDPILDVGGYDPKYKLAIATAHAYGLFVAPENILNVGIQNLAQSDVNYAREKNLRIKLVPTAVKVGVDKIVTYVLPKLVNREDFLYNVENEYNAVTVQAAFADKQFFFGKGAGGHPTGAAVLSDIVALRYDYRYEYKKFNSGHAVQHSDQSLLEVYLRYEDDGLVEKLEFEEISERYAAKNFKYVIGIIKLSSLIKHRDLLLDSETFVAYTSNEVHLERSLQNTLAEKTLANSAEVF